MKRTISALTLTLLASSAMATCNYTLNTTTSDLFGSGEEFPYQSGQTVSHTTSYNVAGSPPQPTTIRRYATTTAGMSSYINALISGGAIGDITLPSSGIVAIELNINNFPTTQPSVGEAHVIGIGFVGGDITTPFVKANLYNFSWGIRNNAVSWPGPPLGPLPIALRTDYSYTEDFVTTSGNYAEHSYSLPLSSGYRLGIYLNTATHQVGLTAGGIDYGYISSYDITHMSKVKFFVYAEDGRIATSDTIFGQTVSATLVTDAASITGSYPVGAKDICGNTI